MATESSQPILARLETIIRRDLKLGPDVAITPDMPFFGGDADIDSLDILLLLSSVEKEFGLRIPSEKVGREIFANAGTLASYIEQNAGMGATVGTDPLARLPHRDPFRFVSRVLHTTPGTEAEGVWQLSGSEAFFAGHFPGQPLVPGVLIAEALAQVCGLAANVSAGAMGRLAHVDVRFEQPVAPPAEIRLQARVARAIGTLQLFDVVALVGETVVARGSIALSFTS